MDIDLYDIIRDVLPDQSKTPMSSTFKSSETPTASAENYDPLTCNEPRDYNAVTFPAEQQGDVDMQASCSESSAESVDYDDVTNTCPVYQNSGSAPAADSEPTAELWSSRLDFLY